MSAPLPRLYVIADLAYMGGLAPWFDLLRQLSEAAEREHFAIQVRANTLDRTTFASAARQARQAVGRHAFVVLNGCAADAAELGYDGVHWPESRIPSEAADAPPPFRSAAVHSVAAIRRAERAAATAVLFGPVFAPRWKAAEARGIGALRTAVQSTELPVYALGGVGVDRVAACLATGAHGVAAVSGIATADPRGAVRAYVRAVRATG